jgi:NMD protein affecting ribosome stability and mRNA decay
MKDCCVQCGNETLYDFTDHIDTRHGYIEGIGQLCIHCYTETTKTIEVPVQLINSTPNDMELGISVRKLYWRSGH